MKRIALASVALALFASAVFAQDVPNPSPPQSINGAYNATPPICLDGHGCVFQTDINGNLKVSGGGGGGLSVVDQAAFTYGTSPFTPTGGFYNSVVTPLLSGQQGAVALTANRSMHVLEDNSSDILSALGAGVGNNGAAGPPASVQVGSVDGSGNLQAASATNPVPVVSPACAPYHLSGATTASTNSNNIKAVAATLCGITAINTTGTIGYLKIYDSSAAAPGPTCSSATGIKHVYPVPANTSGAGIRITSSPGEAYTSGIGFCVTGGGTDTDNTSGPAGIYIEASTK